MKCITWNINSIRLRLPLLQKLVEAENPDILCLQETKTPDALFPLDAINAMGFPHTVFRGEKSYNGVAILSKRPATPFHQAEIGGRDDTRHLAVTLPCGTELHNFYVPAGGDIPDPALNDKFAHKLRFVEEMTAYFRAYSPASRCILTGDLNIAPFEHDVWSHKQLLNVVSHTPPEVERLAALRKTLDWCDVGRQSVPMDQKLYSWWSYRARDWEKSDRGRRLDHIWVTPSLAGQISRYRVLKEVRGWQQPSDHAPVVVEINE